MSAQWVNKTENIIFTKIKARATKSIKELDTNGMYKNLFFTMDSEQSGGTTLFPCVFVHFLPGMELGRSLKGTQINAFRCTMQIQVTASKAQGQDGAREIIWEVVEACLKMGFALNSMPETIPTGNDTKQVVCRLSRVIGYDDIIN